MYSGLDCLLLSEDGVVDEEKRASLFGLVCEIAFRTTHGRNIQDIKVYIKGR